MRLKPLNDFIFKKLFGEKGSEQLLLAFLNAVLQPKMKESIEEVEIIENKVLSKEVITDKTGIIDVRARLGTGEYINVEVQLVDQGNSLERWLAFFQPMVPKETMKELIQMEPAIEAAEKKLTHLSSDEATMELYWERERSLHEKENLVTSAEERGMEKGKKEGIKEGRKEGVLEGKILSAQGLLDILDDEMISIRIGLPVDEVAKLRNKAK